MKPPQKTRLAVWLLALTILAPAAAFLLLRQTTPTDGARLEPGARALQTGGMLVQPLVELPGGLREGDVVVSVGGIPLETWARGIFQRIDKRPEWTYGTSVPYTVIRDGSPEEIEVVLDHYPLGTAAAKNWGSMLYAPVFLLVGAFVYARRPDVPASKALLILSFSIVSATTWSLGLQISDFLFPTGFWLFKLTTVVCYLLFFVAGFHFAVLFPRPLPVLKKHPRIIPAAYGGALLLVLGWTGGSWFFSSSYLDWLDRWIGAEGICAAVFLALTIGAITQQYRVNRSGVTRQQIRWVVWAALFSGGAGLLLYIVPVALGGVSINPNFISFLILPFPVSLAISILKHNLFEIDRLINRTLVFGLLTASVGGVYLAVVWGLNQFFQTWGNLYILLVANFLAAVLFQPLRIWLSRGVNRFMYGKRDEPFEVLAKLSQRLEEAVSLQAALPTIVETVAQTIKLPYVAIAIATTSGMETATSYGKPDGSQVRFPIYNQGEVVGELVANQREADEPFTESEWRLLSSVARQSGAVVQSVLLTEDLKRSRQRLVTAQEEERRRLRRDLHDGLGPTLASHLLKIGSARSVLGRDLSLADTYLDQLEQETEDILVEIRRLVYNLRPPTLDQLGLAGAIQSFANEFNQNQDGPRQLAVRVDVPEKVSVLPAAVEVAAYRIVLEAINNASRHAGARSCRVTLRVEDALHLTICDDGSGLPEQIRHGVGFASMRERAFELGGRFWITATQGGGTEIGVSIPLDQHEAGSEG
jgi:two-component system, NarL family, sensor kinase